MVCVKSYKKGVELLGDVASNENNWNEHPKVSGFFKRVLGNYAAEENLDFYLNQVFPRGTDFEEYEEFFIENIDKITKEIFPDDE